MRPFAAGAVNSVIQIGVRLWPLRRSTLRKASAITMKSADFFE